MTPTETQQKIAELKGWTKLHLAGDVLCGIPPGKPPHIDNFDAVKSNWPTDPAAADGLLQEILEREDVDYIDITCHKDGTTAVIPWGVDGVPVTCAGGNTRPAAIAAAWIELRQRDD